MSLFNWGKKPNPNVNQPFQGKTCPLDSTVGKKPLWVQKDAANSWTDDEKIYRKEVEKYFESITVDAKDSGGYKITNLLSKADEYAIYEVQSSSGSYSIRIDIRTLVKIDELLLDRWTEVAREYYITKRVLFKVNDPSVRERIANIISRALSTGYSSEAIHDLKELQNQINTIYSERIQNSLKYLGTIILIALSFIAYSIHIYTGKYFVNQENLRLLIFSSTAGCIGGFFSVSRRLREMTFEREIPGLTYVLYGFERMVISICGSIIVLLAIKGGLAFEFANKSLFSSLLISVAAGFSETLIPNLLVKIESDKK